LSKSFVARIVWSVAGVADVEVLVDETWPVGGEDSLDEIGAQRGDTFGVRKVEQGLLLSCAEFRKIGGWLAGGDLPLSAYHPIVLCQWLMTADRAAIAADNALFRWSKPAY
jgi:hypothetical protein